MKQHSRPFWIASSIAFCCLVATSPATAQIVPDATLPNNSSVTTQCNINTITGSTVKESNLFHSFDKVLVSTGSTVYFAKAIEPKLPKILPAFSELLMKKYNTSGVVGVSFRLDASTKLDEALEISRTRAARGFCCWVCRKPTPCCGICP